MTNKKFHDGFMAINRKINILKVQKKALIDDWIEENHPLKLGQIIETKGYVYKNKKMQIIHRDIEFLYKTNRWYARGKILKADGTSGKQIGEWFEKMIIED